LLTSSGFFAIKIVEPLRVLGKTTSSSSSSAEELDVNEGTADLGETSVVDGSSGMQCDVVFVRITMGLSKFLVIVAAIAFVKGAEVGRDRVRESERRSIHGP
jgi:hypothetical protein